MEIRKPQHDAIIWSEQFPNLGRSYTLNQTNEVEYYRTIKYKF